MFLSWRHPPEYNSLYGAENEEWKDDVSGVCGFVEKPANIVLSGNFLDGQIPLFRMVDDWFWGWKGCPVICNELNDDDEGIPRLYIIVVGLVCWIGSW